MEQCKNCLGDGIVGNGDVPHLKQGQIVQCPVCKGTGKVGDAPAEEQVAPQAEPVEESPKAEPEAGSTTSESSSDQGVVEPETIVEPPPTVEPVDESAPVVDNSTPAETPEGVTV